jgi:hypothetical protein
LDFQALAAGIGKNKKMRIVRLAFTPKMEAWGPLGVTAPNHELISDVHQVDGFVAYSAGMQSVARRILDNTVDTSDERILRYYWLRKFRELDRAPLETLEALAMAIRRATPLVGGPDQIGVFTREGKCLKWSSPTLPLNRQKLLSTVLNLGNTFTPDGLLTVEEYRDAKGKKLSTEMNISLVQPFEQPFTQVFVAARFRGVQVALDGNAFVGNEFNNVVFKYKGGPIFFANNAVKGCTLQLPPSSSVPPGLMSCAVQYVTQVDLERTLGIPLRAQPHGCVTRNRYGRSRLYRKSHHRTYRPFGLTRKAVSTHGRLRFRLRGMVGVIRGLEPRFIP